MRKPSHRLTGGDHRGEAHAECPACERTVRLVVRLEHDVIVSCEVTDRPGRWARDGRIPQLSHAKHQEPVAAPPS